VRDRQAVPTDGEAEPSVGADVHHAQPHALAAADLEDRRILRRPAVDQHQRVVPPPEGDPLERIDLLTRAVPGVLVR